ncbi:MAG: DNA polymerase IV, partial [Deltaproteobacteria bacterium]|nr:DNA polymerase IV [Deltaproteobacteria bacterium]
MTTERIIMHVDMDAFFASVEQKCDPTLRGKAIAVIGSDKRTVVTTSSYEARARGVRTGMNKYEAKRVCPELILVVGDNKKYMHASTKVFEILKRTTPLVEPCSIDEGFIDVTGQHSMGSKRDIADYIRGAVEDEIGITCSVGVAPNKLLAKLASGMQKPNGVTIIESSDIKDVIESLPVKKLCGIGSRMETHLKAMGVRTCGELGNFPVSALRRRFGITGERLSLMGQGIDVLPVVPISKDDAVKSIGHSRTLPKDVRDPEAIRRYLLKLTEMVCRRARRYELMGSTIAVTIRYD